jgi:hypothetical protein
VVLIGRAFSCQPGNGGARRDRTDDLLLAKQALSQLSYGPVAAPNARQRCIRGPLMLVGLGRFELPTSPLSGVRSNQLSYRPGTLTHAHRVRPTGHNWRAPGLHSKTGNLLWVLANGPAHWSFGSLVKGGDPAARSRTATLLRLHPSH